MFFGWVLVAAALCCVCVAQTQRGVCTNDEYGFVTRFVRSGASFSQTSSAFAEPFLYTDCQSVRVGSEALRLCRATDCARVDLGFFVKEIDPTDEFSLRWCECGKPVPPIVPFQRANSDDPNADFDGLGSLRGVHRTQEEVDRDAAARAKLLPRIRLGACGKAPTSLWSTGCPEDEITKECIGGVWPGTKVFADMMSKSFFGSWRGRTYECTYVGQEREGQAFPPYNRGTLSDHADGAAWDAIVKEGNLVLGNQIADFVCKNWQELGVKYAIFNGRRCANGVWSPLRSGNMHTHAIHVSLMRLSAMYLTEDDMRRILRQNGLEPKYPIYEYENEVQVIGVNDDPRFILPVPKRTIFFRQNNNNNNNGPAVVTPAPRVTPKPKPTTRPIRRRN